MLPLRLLPCKDLSRQHTHGWMPRIIKMRGSSVSCEANHTHRYNSGLPMFISNSVCQLRSVTYAEVGYACDYLPSARRGAELTSPVRYNYKESRNGKWAVTLTPIRAAVGLRASQVEALTIRVMRPQNATLPWHQMPRNPRHKKTLTVSCTGHRSLAAACISCTVQSRVSWCMLLADGE